MPGGHRSGTEGEIVYQHPTDWKGCDGDHLAMFKLIAAVQRIDQICQWVDKTKLGSSAVGSVDLMLLNFNKSMGYRPKRYTPRPAV